jgi:undecaprenyl-diphosphatase
VGGSAIGIFIVLIGVSRVYIGVHYPSDILGGYTVGLLGVFLGVITMYALHIWLHHLNHSVTRQTKSR